MIVLNLLELGNIIYENMTRIIPLQDNSLLDIDMIINQYLGINDKETRTL